MKLLWIQSLALVNSGVKEALKRRTPDAGAQFGHTSISRSVWTAAPLAPLLGLVLAGTSMFVPLAGAQPNPPHLGYVYPAGLRRGSTTEIAVGGQYLNGATNVWISGDGVRATVLEYNRPLTQKEFNDLRDELRSLREKRRSALTNRSAFAVTANSTNVWTTADETRWSEIREKILKNPLNRLGNPALAETATLQVVAGADAEPGEREIRFGSPAGLSNPFRFRIGELPEYSKPPAKIPLELGILRELNPNNAPVAASSNVDQHVTLPAVINGQIMPGEVDRIRFAARKGQELVITAGARDLIPYLADAVPGWFQATLRLSDARGRELAYDDRYRFHPDPVIHCVVPQDGEYVLEIKDSLYRGRQDFVYRISAGELPFITSVFPLGGPARSETEIELTGWNLPANHLVHTNTERGVYPIFVSRGGRSSNPVPFAVDTLPEQLEREPNDTMTAAQTVALPIIVNGRIGAPGDCDIFRFEGRAGEEIVAEITARRLDSPLDSVIDLTDSAGRQLAVNDDFEDKGSGLNTHHADSYLRATLPANGTYFVRVRDAQGHGGVEFAYRLRLSAPRPDFELRVTPSSLTVRGGGQFPLTVYALRRDGFTNEIILSVKNGPGGVMLSGARVPPNQDQVRLTVGVPPAASGPIALSLEGRATVGGEEIVRTAVPADDLMQAFAYRHLVPAQELEIVVLPRVMGRVNILGDTPVRIPRGGAAHVRLGLPSPAFAERFDLELSDAPGGITLKSAVPSVPGELDLVLQADAAKVKAGLEGNLIVNVLPKAAGARRGNTPARQRNPAGVLPAIPFRVTDL